MTQQPDFGSAPFNPRFSFLAVLLPDGRVAHINEATLRASGVDRDAAAGQLFWELPWLRDTPAAAQWPDRLRQVVATGVPWEGQDEFHGSDGIARGALVAVSAMRDPAGRVAHVLVEAQDVTQERLQLLELRETEAMLSSAQRQATERYRELSEQLTRTLESITDSFMTFDRDWRFTYLNQHAEKPFRRSRDELIGKVVWELYPEAVGSVFYQQYHRALEEQATVRFEAYSDTLAGWMQVTAYPSPQGLAVYFRNVTERRAIRRALVESEERYRLLFESSVDPILQTAPRGRILRANPAACVAFGLSEAGLRGVSARTLVAPDDSLRLRALVDERNRAGRAVGQLTLLRADGSRFEVEATTSRYFSSDGEPLTNIIFRDITLRLRQETEILRMNADLGERVKQRTMELERANAELRGFAHSLAHDLRTPVATIRGFSRSLEDKLAGVAAERELHRLRRIHAAAVRMDDFIEALLSLATVSQSPVLAQCVDLSEMARLVVNDLQERDGAQRRVAVRVQGGLRAFGDARLLRMLLENLIGNAWKFSSRREDAAITFGATEAPDGAGVVYFVEDNGAGFDMAYSERLFGNFQRLHRDSEFPGTGIGLANVQRIVQRHGGRVWAEGKEGVGAVFRFTLALEPSLPGDGLGDSPLAPSGKDGVR